MLQPKFTIHDRLRSFQSKLHLKRVLRPSHLTIFLGWLISFYLLFVFLSLKTAGGFVIFILTVHYVFWFRVIDRVREIINPPIELIITLSLVLLQINLLLIAAAYTPSDELIAGTLLGIIQLAVLSVLILLVSILLVRNNQDKKGILIVYLVLGAVVFYFLHKDALLTSLFFQLILLLMLLARTSWLEELSRTECWIYWVAAILFFLWFYDQPPLRGTMPEKLELALMWQKIPHFLFLLIKIYLLVLIIKIPVVLIYNHARLSRKLKIAGLFQSSFPQFIQFVVIIIMSFFFMSGWQGENLRRIIQRQLNKIYTDNSSEKISKFAIAPGQNDVQTSIDGYRPVSFVNKPNQYQVIGMVREDAEDTNSERDYFLYYADSTLSQPSAYFIRIDSSFLRLVATDLPILAGSILEIYPFYPSNRIESIVYRANSQSMGSLSRHFPFTLLPHNENNLQIFPFTFTPFRHESGAAFDLNSHEKEDGHFVLDLGSRELRRGKLTTGRVFIPLVSEASKDEGYFAFDIILVPQLSFSFSPLVKLLGFLSLIYASVNLLVTRRMVKFGEQINQLVVRRFGQLRKGIREISSGNLDYRIRLEGEDEFVELADRFNRMGEKLQENLAESIEKQRLEHELGIARNVQISLLPRELPTIPGYEIAASLKTATEVGGDFYDVLPLKKDRYLITIGDVSGKGSSAALYMAQCISLIRFAQQFTDAPGEIADRLNNYFSDPQVDRHTFVTAIVGILDTRRHRFKFVRAGHTYPVVIPGSKSKAVYELRGEGIGIGIAKDSKLFTEKLDELEQRLSPRDVLILYSDGLIEAARLQSDTGSEIAEMEHYGAYRFKDLLDLHRGASAVEILSAIERDIESFYGKESPVDDYTLIVLKRTEGSRTKRRLSQKTT